MQKPNIKQIYHILPSITENNIRQSLTKQHKTKKMITRKLNYNY